MTGIPTFTKNDISFSEFLRTWTKVALLSFGGPAGQIAMMHRILVDEKKWIDEDRFLHALNFCMLLPGPEAQQLATYVGWLLKGIRGGLIAGVLFIMPGIIAVMALSWFYALFSKTEFVQIFFYGLKAAILAIVVEALIRISKRALKNKVSYYIAAGAFIAMFALHIPFPFVILAAALIGFFAVRPHNTGLPFAFTTKDNVVSPHPNKNLLAAFIFFLLWAIPVLGTFLFLGEQHIFSQIGLFFSKMAVVTFGGAYAVLAYVAQEAVQNFGWLQPGEMLDGLGMAETTPGPLIMVLQFVGFIAAFRHSGMEYPLLAGTLGGLLTTWVTFTPCFLWIFLGAPYIEKLRHKRKLNSALSGVTAAVVGVILNLSIWFGLHTLFSQVDILHLGYMHFLWPELASLRWPSLIICLFAFLCLFLFKWGIIRTLFVCSFSAYFLLLLFSGL